MKRVLSLLLAVALVVSAAPQTAFAAGSGEIPSAGAQDLSAQSFLPSPEAGTMSTVASGTCGDDLTWTLSDNGVLEITGTGSMTNWSSEYAVPWYSEHDRIVHAVVGSGVTNISSNAFYSCTELTDISLPETLTGIGSWAFYMCSSLTSLTIPASVSNISTSHPFGYCSSLTGINVSPDNRYYASQDGVVYRKDMSSVLFFPPGKSGHYTMPDTVLSVAEHAFYRCTQLTGITFSESLTVIYREGFIYCTGLTSITLPASLGALQSRAFGGCTGLESITFMGDAPKIEADSFARVTAWAYYPQGNETWTEEYMKSFGGSLSWNPHTFTPGLEAEFSHSTSFGNDLSINYFVTDTEELQGATLWLEGEKDVWDAAGTSKEVRTFQITDHTTGTTQGITEHKFVFSGIAAKEMGDEVRVRLAAEKTVDGATVVLHSDWDVYSVADYAYNRLEKTQKTRFRTLLVDMLNYGAAAQTRFSYRTNAPVNARLTAEQKAWGTQADITSDGVPEPSVLDLGSATPKVGFTGKTAVFGNSVELKYYFELLGTTQPSNVHLRLRYTTVDGTQKVTDLQVSGAEYDPEHNEYCLSFAGVAAKDMGQQVQAWFMSNGYRVSDLINYSLENYCFNRLQASTNEAFKTLIRAALKYGRAARGYFEHPNE